MPFPLNWIWPAAMLVKLLAVAVLLHRRLALIYVGLTVYLVGSAVKSMWLWNATLHRGSYYPSWISSQSVSIALYAILMFHTLYLQAKHFPKIRNFAIALFGLFAWLSFSAMLATAGIGAAAREWWPEAFAAAAAIASSFSGVCLLTLLSARWFFGRMKSVTMRANVQAHVAITIWLLAGEVLGMGWLRWTGYKVMPMVGQLLIVGTPLVCAIAWVWRLRPAGEAFTPPRQLTPEEISERDQEWENAEAMLHSAARKAFRKSAGLR